MLRSKNIALSPCCDRYLSTGRSLNCVLCAPSAAGELPGLPRTLTAAIAARCNFGCSCIASGTRRRHLTRNTAMGPAGVGAMLTPRKVMINLQNCYYGACINTDAIRPLSVLITRVHCCSFHATRRGIDRDESLLRRTTWKAVGSSAISYPANEQ